MENHEPFITNRRRYRPVSLPRLFSDEEMARDWTLSDSDKTEVGKYRKDYRLFVAVQLCALRLYGRFLGEANEVSPRIVNYLNTQLELPPSLIIRAPERAATVSEQRMQLLTYLGHRKFDDAVQTQLQGWLAGQTQDNVTPDQLFQRAESYLLSERIILPGTSVLERLIISHCAATQEQLFVSLQQQLSPDLRQAIDRLLTIPEEQQRTYFYQLKEYPPAASVSALQDYLKRYETLAGCGVGAFTAPALSTAFLTYLFQLAKRYSAKDLKRFKDPKRYALMVCFLLETRKTLLDHLVQLHDQFLTDMCRHCHNAYEQHHREIRKRHKKAVDTVLAATGALLNWPADQELSRERLWQEIDQENLRESAGVLRIFKRLEERGYGDLLLARYPSLRKYFAEFIRLPFAAEPGSEPLLQAIGIVRQLDAGKLKALPADAPAAFVPQELRRALTDADGGLNRNAWETGLALAIKDALRSRDLYLPDSRHHVSFWNLTLSDAEWQQNQDGAYAELEQPRPEEARPALIEHCRESAAAAVKGYALDDFAVIEKGVLRLKRDDAAAISPAVISLQKAIDANMPPVRIEQLLMEVDQMTGFSRHFVPVQNHGSRPQHFYKTLMAVLVSQATNLGVVSMSASVKDITVDMLRHILQFYVREETLKAASAEIVNQHHLLPLSAAQGDGTMSSSDAQRFKVRADTLLASFYPRYYGYYERAIGIYTHVSDQYSVFDTGVISCGPREALYVLDGLLNNNTILKIREHTTDTHGYTEIVFALCHLLGFAFMPRIRDLKDQQLYRADKTIDYGVFSPLLTKTADIALVEEQWEAMIRVALSLKQRTAPAHVIVQRLTNSFPADRLSKAFTNLGRIIKTEYILRYFTDPVLRRRVQLQLNKGEYRHKLPRWIFFAEQGEFTTGDYEEIMNKASCLSLVSNAILYWNTIKIDTILERFREQGEVIDNDTLSHISLLPFKHVLPHGIYFTEG
jgi:TnpA family transposase